MPRVLCYTVLRKIASSGTTTARDVFLTIERAAEAMFEQAEEYCVDTFGLCSFRLGQLRAPRIAIDSNDGVVLHHQGDIVRVIRRIPGYIRGCTEELFAEFSVLPICEEPVIIYGPDGEKSLKRVRDEPVYAELYASFQGLIVNDGRTNSSTTTFDVRPEEAFELTTFAPKDSNCHITPIVGVIDHPLAADQFQDGRKPVFPIAYLPQLHREMKDKIVERASRTLKKRVCAELNRQFSEQQS
jgi:hypothetical protein